MLKNILDYFLKGLQMIMAILMALMVAVMFSQVVMRYFFHTGIFWAEEFTRFANIYVVFIGAVVITASDSQIRVTLLEDFIRKGTARKILTTLQYLITMAYAVFITRVGLDTLRIVRRQRSPSLQITMDYMYVIIPAATALMLLFLIVNLIRLYMNKPETT